MKKKIAAFILGGVITAGAFGLSYGFPITSAAEKTTTANPAEGMVQQCTETMKNPDTQNMMKSMMPDSKATADPKAVEDMTKQCTELMKNPEMQTMMNSMQSSTMPAGDMNHSAHHQ